MADNNFEDIDEMLTKEIDMSKGYTLDEILACLYEAATKAFNHDLISPTELVGVRIAHEILASMPPDVNFLGEDSIVKTNVGVDLTMDPPSIEEAQKMLTVAHSVLDLPAVPPGLEEIAEKVIKACSEYLEDSCEELAPPPPERSRAPESPLEDFKSALKTERKEKQFDLSRPDQAMKAPLNQVKRFVDDTMPIRVLRRVKFVN